MQTTSFASRKLGDLLFMVVNIARHLKVDPAQARHKSEYQNQVIYFCCAGCKQAFDKAPEKYAFATL